VIILIGDVTNRIWIYSNSNRAIELAGGVMGSKAPVHPNDHVNRGINVCICIYIYTYVYIHVFIYECIYVSKHSHIFVHMFKYVSI
jgi:hypothetical protein